VQAVATNVSSTGRLTIPVVHAPATDRHDVASGVWCGVTEASDELPSRASAILEAVTGAGATIQYTDGCDRAAIERVHDRRMLDVLASAYERWVEDGHLTDPGSPYVTAYFFPGVGGIHGGNPDRPAKTIRAEIGRFAMDTMTTIGYGTWDAALAAAGASVAAADLVLAGDGAPIAAYALTRPPGHHAGPNFFGGSCYLNNAAIAARHLHFNGVERVAVVDIDAHHGNGTQAVFWDDPTTLYISLHVDPGEGWFPHTVGYADEIDECATNRNLPLAPGSGDHEWLEALDASLAATEAFGAEAVVVSLGVDAADGLDPGGRLCPGDTRRARSGGAASVRWMSRSNRQTHR
jgi:acetoin utilization deacetylase AcuC-like enzyme